MDSDDSVHDAWDRGSYDEIARNYLSVAADLVEETAVSPDDDVLDVGCGTGNVAISAARRGADVTGVDVTPAMLSTARDNAALAGVGGEDGEDGDCGGQNGDSEAGDGDAGGVEWRRGTATDLPFDDDAFDVTLSCLGHMYGDPPDAAARELVRVTRPGGRIAFAAWTPTDLFPFLAGVLSTYVPPAALPEFTEPPFMWGDSGTVTDRLGDAVSELDVETKPTTYPALSPAHFWREMATRSGTVIELLEHVDEADRPALRDEAVETIAQYFDDGRNAVELQYLRTTARV